MNKMRQSRPSNIQPFGLGNRFRHVSQAFVIVGLGLLATGVFAQAAMASGVEQPTLTSTRATFDIKAGNPSSRVWVLSVWEMTSPQKLVGESTGTSGLLVVTIPQTTSCFFQVDVNRNGAFYSGFRRTVAFCGGVSVSSTTSPPTTSAATTSPPTTSSPSTTKITAVKKPKTSGGSGGSTTTTTKPASTGSGSGGGGTTSVPPSKLAFTGAGFALWLMALFGALLLISGSLLLIYARRYPREA